jgi:hypothetical protein
MKFFLIILIPIIILNLSNQAFAQNTGNGSVQIIQDERIDYLLLKSKMQNQTDSSIEGFRIQIFFDSGYRSKTSAEEVRDSFMEKFPEEPVYITFKEPYYRVRVGDFRSRLEAEGLLQMIRLDWPNAFIVKDRINFPPL